MKRGKDKTMPIDQEVAACFDALDERIKTCADAMTATEKAVADAQAAFRALQKVPSRRPNLHVPGWLTRPW
jgi:hypothetical protein